ncbi:MAG: DUF2569 domain-containing protein [Planctomycetes bacterium]|nr:DUF2569 domain-containing protein [Planctomycetota bacterium]
MDPKVEPALPNDPQVPAAPRDTAVPPAIGGWLVVPAVGLVVALVETVAGVVIPLVNRGRYAEQGGILLVDLVVSAGVILWLLLAAFRFFARKSRAPETMIAVMITYVGAQAALIGLSFMLSAGVSATAWGSLLAGAAFAVVWVPYFLVSRRVKRTFVNP